jgi:hypothetical protein
MSPTTEADIVDRLASELQAEGYEVFPQPRPLLLPAFLQGQSVDLIARRGDKSLAVEVASRSGERSKSLRQLASLFEGRTDWELRVIWLDDRKERFLTPQSSTTIDAKLEELRKLADDGHLAPAIVFGWSVFEAIGRAILPDNLAKPQTPGRLVSELAGAGDITPTEADGLREIAELRNLLVHGSLAEPVADEQVESFISILEKLHRELSPAYA